MKPEDQMIEWIEGNSMHNHEYASCCPDFSCCLGEIVLVEKSTREDFLYAYRRGEWLIVQSYLNIFLGKALRNGLSLKPANERDI